MKKIIIALTILFAFVATTSSWAGLGDVAIFSEATGWISKDNADIQRAIVFDNLKNEVSSVGDVVYKTDAEIGPWAEERIDDGKADILVIFGWFPTTLYTPGNSQVDDSIAERFLYGGNIILNCADYAFYVTEGGGANGENGLKTIININADMWVVVLLLLQQTMERNILQHWWISHLNVHLKRIRLLILGVLKPNSAIMVQTSSIQVSLS